MGLWSREEWKGRCFGMYNDVWGRPGRGVKNSTCGGGVTSKKNRSQVGFGIFCYITRAAEDV